MKLPLASLSTLLLVLAASANAQSIEACNGNERKGYTAAPITLPPAQHSTKEMCVRVPASVIITRWTCEFAKDGHPAQFCQGLGNGSCDAIGWVWPESPRVFSEGNFNVYCITGHQDSGHEWRYFRIHLYNDDM